MWIVCPSEPLLWDQKWHNHRESSLECMEGEQEPPTWISARVPWLCWPYEALHCHGAEYPTGELAWLFRFNRLKKVGQDLRVTLGIHCCPVLQGVYQKGAVLVKEERQHNLCCTCVDGLGFFMVVTLDASTGDVLVSILVRCHDTKIHLQPPLIPETHSLE